MARFAHYDPTNGRIIGFYDEDIHSEIPKPSRELSGSEWEDRFDKRIDVEVGSLPLVPEDPVVFQPEDAHVNDERDRRLAIGATVEVEGYGPVPVQGRQADQTNLLALKDTARDLEEAGVTDAVIEFRDGANVLHLLTPAQMKDLANKGKAAASEIYSASWALKDNPPIPADYAADAYWP